MARDLALDLNTMDLKWPLQYITGRAEVQQCLIVLMMTPKGTFLDYPDVGMDYSCLYGKLNPGELRLAINNALKEDHRVTKVNRIDVKPSDNGTQANVYIDVSTTLGEIKFAKEMNTHAPN